MSNFVQELVTGGLDSNHDPFGGKINKTIFGNRLGTTINQLPLDMIVGPVTGAMAATGPASQANAQHIQQMLYGKNNVPSNMQQWINWNTQLQPKPKKTTTSPSGGIIF